MRAALLLTLLLTSASVASDRFAPDNPWFRDFEAACRVGMDMSEDCKGSVLGAYAEYSGASEVDCDFVAFWQARDEQSGDMFTVLPWQYGVEFLVAVEGVCSPAIQPGFNLTERKTEY